MSEQNKNAGAAPFLDVKDLVVEYYSDGKVIHAVNGVNLTLERGKTLCLVGETGAGKTTIAKSILRILPDVGAKVAGGTITLDGQDLLGLPEHEMRKIRGNKISMIFQDPMTALNPVQTVGDQIAEAVRLHNGGNKGEAEERAEEMLKMVGISADRYHEYPHQFSGGMKQRVVIAIALACNPDLLLADEPTTALDVTIQAQVLDLIGELRKSTTPPCCSSPMTWVWWPPPATMWRSSMPAISLSTAPRSRSSIIPAIRIPSDCSGRSPA